MGRKAGSTNKSKAKATPLKKVEQTDIGSQFDTNHQGVTYTSEQETVEYDRWLQNNLIKAQIRAANATAGITGKEYLIADDDLTRAVDAANKEMYELKESARAGDKSTADYWRWQSYVNQFKTQDPREVAYFAVKTSEKYARSNQTKAFVGTITGESEPGTIVKKLKSLS